MRLKKISEPIEPSKHLIGRAPKSAVSFTSVCLAMHFSHCQCSHFALPGSPVREFPRKGPDVFAYLVVIGSCTVSWRSPAGLSNQSAESRTLWMEDSRCLINRSENFPRMVRKHLLGAEYTTHRNKASRLTNTNCPSKSCFVNERWILILERCSLFRNHICSWNMSIPKPDEPKIMIQNRSKPIVRPLEAFHSSYC